MRNGKVFREHAEHLPIVVVGSNIRTCTHTMTKHTQTEQLEDIMPREFSIYRPKCILLVSLQIYAEISTILFSVIL